MIFINDEKIAENTVVALGIFDGVHIGHRMIFDKAKSRLQKTQKLAVFTFKTSSVLKKHGQPYEYIYTEAQKNDIFERLGADYVYSPEITSLMDMSGERFCREILKEKMNAEAVVCGKNFRFGKGASCGAEQLKLFGEKYGFEVLVCDILQKYGEEVSSGKIKEYLKNGEISKANELLGENYFVAGEVVAGNRIGRTINFPTLNQLFEDRQIVPKMGAYAACCNIHGKSYGAVTNIGVKPTVEKDIKPLAETHVSGFCGDIYGENVKIEILKFIRAEKKFPSVEHLKNQIEIDLKTANEIYLSKNSGN